MNSEIKDKAEIIMAEIYFNVLEVQKVISWAKLVRSMGFNSLASFLIVNNANRSDEEIVRLFLELKSELQIETTNNPEFFYKKYALYVAVQYLKKELKSEKALNKILIITQEADDKDHYLEFVNFCMKYNILERHLKFKNLKNIQTSKAMNELDSIFLHFAEKTHELRLRIQLNKRSLHQLIEARHIDNEVYDDLSLIIIDDILANKGIGKAKIKSILKKIKSERRN